MSVGDTLVYGNKAQVKIVNFLTINGNRGVQLKGPDMLLKSEQFKSLDQVEDYVAKGIWSIERAKPKKKTTIKKKVRRKAA
jgi:hypothetical protein